jgi:hypothetical protein
MLSGLSCIGYMILNEIVIVNDELGSMWKEVVVAYFTVLSQRLPGGRCTEETNENPVRITRHVDCGTSQIQSGSGNHYAVIFAEIL